MVQLLSEEKLRTSFPALVLWIGFDPRQVALCPLVTGRED